MIATAHPGKHGDAIYALPAIRALCDRHGCQADFYTSDYCAPLKELFEYQRCIHKFYVAPNYVVERMDMGCLPARVPVDESLYESTFQMGYKGTPNCYLPEFIAQSVGVNIDPVRYEVPEPDWFSRPYIVLAARGDTSYKNLFAEIVERCPITVIAIGGKGDGDCVKQILDGRYGKTTLDCTGWNYLDTASLISGAKAFVSISSSQLCLANGFPIPRICVHDGIHWDERHWLNSPMNFYPVNPSAEEVIELIGSFL